MKKHDTVLSSKNNPFNKKKEFQEKVIMFNESKQKITNHIEQYPEKTPAEVTKWMQENLEIHLHMLDSQVRDLVYNYRKEWMLTQESYASDTYKQF